MTVGNRKTYFKRLFQRKGFPSENQMAVKVEGCEVVSSQKSLGCCSDFWLLAAAFYG
jgi:hypothetical protein